MTSKESWWPRARLATIVVLALAVAACASADRSVHHQHRFEDAERWARVFEDPAREAWQKPREVIQALGLRPDAVVADLGSGTGYFAVPLARAVPQGHVYGVDIEPDMVRYLNARAQREGLGNLTSYEALPHDPRLPRAVDLVLVVDTYHHIASRVEYFAALRAGLARGGRVAIIDFREDAPTGPPRRFRLPPDAVEQEMGRAGYTLVAGHGFLPHQYFLVFAPAPR